MMPSESVRRVAALYDVHGNLPALEAAIAAAEEAGVDLFVLGGDLALGPMPREVMDRLADLGPRMRCLRGNCDRLMVDAFDGRTLPALPDAVREAVAWSASQLSQRHRDFLAALPQTLTLDVHGLGEVLFCHATPASDEEIITVHTPEERLQSVLAGVEQHVVVCGHTHVQFERDVGEVLLVNAGSVGMPSGEPGAQWLQLGANIEFRRTSYDVASAVERIEATAYPGARDFAARYVAGSPVTSQP
jgi:putative phosphoesterase